MIEPAQRALVEVLKAKSGERFLVIVDQSRQAIGEAFFEAGRVLRMQTETYLLPEAQRPLKQVPSDLVSKLGHADLAVTLLRSLSEETAFRVALVKQVVQHGVRLGHGPGITEAMMLNGPMKVDYAAMVDRATRLMQILDRADALHITAPGGSDLTLKIRDRGWETDVWLPDDRIANLPCGEIWCAPIETSANGILVCDGSIGDFGRVPAPLKLFVTNGRVTGWDCEDDAFGNRVYEALTLDDDADLLGELGIGINAGARVSGELLEDEKALETIHIAFGNNEFMPGGQNRSRTHRDFLVRKPDIVVTYQDGSQRHLLKQGLLQMSGDKRGMQ